MKNLTSILYYPEICQASTPHTSTGTTTKQQWITQEFSSCFLEKKKKKKAFGKVSLALLYFQESQGTGGLHSLGVDSQSLQCWQVLLHIVGTAKEGPNTAQQCYKLIESFQFPVTKVSLF